jgi:GTP cyclohydrolase I
MSFVKVDSILPSLSRRSTDQEALEALYVVGVLEKNMTLLFGDYAIGNVRIRSYIKGVLTLNVVSNVWAHRLRMQENLLKKNINALLNAITITRVRYRISSIEN